MARATDDNSDKSLTPSRMYLLVYNTFMFICFTATNFALTFKLFNDTITGETIDNFTLFVGFLTYAQLLETVHAAAGIVPGGFFLPLLQTGGRIFAVQYLFDEEIRRQAEINATYMFIVWSMIEVFRYSLYALKMINIEIYAIKWCRYTLFAPLYPLGGSLEASVILFALEKYERDNVHGLSLPNAANISFDIQVFCKLYCYVLLGPTILLMMRYMSSQRAKQLS